MVLQYKYNKGNACLVSTVLQYKYNKGNAYLVSTVLQYKYDKGNAYLVSTVLRLDIGWQVSSLKESLALKH